MKRSLWGALALAGTLAACSRSSSLTGSDATSLTDHDLTGQDSTSGGTTKPDSVDNGSAWVRVIGTLNYSDQCPTCTTTAIVPREVRPREPFSVTVNTEGYNGCFRKGDTEVTVRDSLARVVAYDSVPFSAMVCTAVMKGFRHDATVRFESPGKATVRVVGYVRFGGEQRLDSLDYKVNVGP